MNSAIERFPVHEDRNSTAEFKGTISVSSINLFILLDIKESRLI